MVYVLRFVFFDLRSPSADGIQLAEVTLYSANGSAIRVQTAENPNGLADSEYHRPQSAVDGLLTTKWYDASIVSRNRSELILQCGDNGSVWSTPPSYCQTACAPVDQPVACVYHSLTMNASLARLSPRASALNHLASLDAVRQTSYLLPTTT